MHYTAQTHLYYRVTQKKATHSLVNNLVIANAIIFIFYIHEAMVWDGMCTKFQASIIKSLIFTVIYKTCSIWRPALCRHT